MQLAQRLYEGADIDGETVGLITYMRTDGVDLAPEAISSARSVIAREFGDAYVPKAPRKYTVKAKNAQEAHEAIRPTDLTRLPRGSARALEPDQAKLYELIWTRTIASQMESAELERTTVDILAEAGDRKLDLRATGPGHPLRRLSEALSGRPRRRGGRGRRPAALYGEGRAARRKSASTSTQHFTEPPPRFTEATLVKRMEELGIGRPSTYASTLAVLRERDYVRIDKKRLYPEDKGRLVTAFLESFFTRYVEYDFTADLEEKLDQHLESRDRLEAGPARFLARFFTAALDGTKDLRTTQVLDALNDILAPHIFPPKPDGSNPRACPSCGDGQLSLKLGKFGAFVGCSNYPECKFTRTLVAANGDGAETAPGDRPGVRVLGVDPADRRRDHAARRALWRLCAAGRGRKAEALLAAEDDPRRRTDARSGDRASVAAARGREAPRDEGADPGRDRPLRPLRPARQDLCEYRQGRRYPCHRRQSRDRPHRRQGERPLGRRFGDSASAPARALGEHPSGGPVTLRAGRYGPYVNHGKINATLPKDADPTTLDLDGALALLAAKASGGGGAAQGRLLGEHPSGGPITVRAGRFGAYVNHGKTNATLKANASPEAITLEEAIRLIEDKEAAGGGAERKAPAPKKSAPKAPRQGSGRRKSPTDDDSPPFETAAKRKSAPARKPAAKRQKASRRNQRRKNRKRPNKRE